MNLRRAHVVAGLAALALAGNALAAPAPTAPTQKSLGANLAGEACHSSGTAASGQPLDIKCGTGPDTVGRLRVANLAAALPADQTARHEAILRDVKAMPGGLGANEQVSCDAGQWLSGDNALLICTLNSNSWPRIIVVSASDRTLYKAEGLPALLPVLQAAIASASGRPTPQADSDAAVRALEAKLPKEVVHSSGADFSSYKQFVELGRLYGGANNFAGAETAYRHALEIETRLFGANAVTVGETIAELALQVSNQGRFQEAADLFHRAGPLIEGSSSASARARLASYLALDAANQRRFADALKFAREATAQRRTEIAALGGGDADAGIAGPGVSRGELAHSLRIEASMALRLDDTAGARAAAEEALWIVSQEPGLPLWWRPDVVSLMADINEREGRVVAAERDYKDALELDKKLFGDTAPTAIAALKLGRFYAGQQVYPASVASFRTALAILAKDRIARSQIVPDQIVPFIAAADGLASSHPEQRVGLNAEMFRASQLVNSGVADQTIARAAARQAAGNPALAALVREAQDAQRVRDNARIDLAAEFAKPDDERNADRERKLSDAVKAASARADAANAKVQQAFPDYARLAEPGPAELADMQAQLQPGEAFLSYVIGYKGSYALLVTGQGLKVYKLDVGTAKLAEDIADLRRAFTPRLGGLSDFSLKSSASLYRQLMGPLEGDLGGVNHLIVASEGDLASLPLSLLVTSDSGRSYTDAAWLIRRTALSQVPSPGAFLSLRDARLHHSPAPRPFLGLGDPTFTGTRGAKGNALDLLAGGCRESGPMPPDMLRALPPLHETAGEVRAVASQLGGGGGTVLLAGEATETNLRAHPLDQYAVLYFATHGLLPGELRCQSEPGLVLSPPGHMASSTSADGLLESGEIAGLKLNADLVVLSACNTAASGGGRFGGGALEGLSEAFFNAGARAVLASHWEVPSASTNRLMTGVFSRYGHDRDRGLAEALRQSQLALIAQSGTAHPFHWAAFTVIGDGAGGSPHSAQQALKGGRS